VNCVNSNNALHPAENLHINQDIKEGVVSNLAWGLLHFVGSYWPAPDAVLRRGADAKPRRAAWEAFAT